LFVGEFEKPLTKFRGPIGPEALPVPPPVATLF